MALSTTVPVILLKSGLSRKWSPSRAPGNITEQAVSTIMMTNRAGIIILEKRSIPLLTPRTTMKWVVIMKAKSHNNGFQGLLTKLANMEGKSAVVLPSKLLETARMVYSAVQPATTE